MRAHGWPTKQGPHGRWDGAGVRRPLAHCGASQVATVGPVNWRSPSEAWAREPGASRHAGMWHPPDVRVVGWVGTGDCARGGGGRAHDLWLAKPTCRPLSYIGSCLLQGTGCGLRAHVGNERGWGLFRTLANASEPVVGRQLQTSRGTNASHTSGPISRSVCVCVPVAWQTCARPLHTLWHATPWQHIQLVTKSVAGPRCSGGRGVPMPEAGRVARSAHGVPRLACHCHGATDKKPPVGFEPSTSRLLSGCSAS